MARRGRPRKEIKKDAFEKLCQMQCTEKEICGWFGVCEDTLNAWCKRTYGKNFTDTYKIYSQDGLISLRRHQFKLAEKYPAMAIFLGKQYLGQSDRVSQTITTVSEETRFQMDQMLDEIIEEETDAENIAADNWVDG